MGSKKRGAERIVDSAGNIYRNSLLPGFDALAAPRSPKLTYYCYDCKRSFQDTWGREKCWWCSSISIHVEP